jgi:hypothetical protein
MQTLNLSPEPEKTPEADYETVSRIKNGANWFYWIGGISLVNSLILLFGGNWNFFAGLGLTQIVDAIALNVSETDGFSIAKIIALLLDSAIVGIFIGCGFFAGKLQIWAFIVGMVLYALDGILILVLGSYLAAGFHVFVLFMIFRGLKAARELYAAKLVI